MNSSKLYQGFGIALVGLLVIGLASFANAQDVDPITEQDTNPVIEEEVSPIPPADTDNDGVADELDNCPAVANLDQVDIDSDGVGDACDEAVETDEEEGGPLLQLFTAPTSLVAVDDICHWDNGKKEYTLAPNNPGHAKHELDVPVNDAGGCPTETPSETVLHAQKIVCDDESDLPNWGAGNVESSIDADTAQDWLDEVGYNLGCSLTEWDFEWSFRSVAGDPEDNVGPLGGDWTAFTDGVAVIDVSNANDLGIRESLESGYIPFTGQNTDRNVSAEIYCGNDVLHYDNWEWIDAVAGEEYYCVAWNVSEKKDPDMCDLTVVSDTTNLYIEGDVAATEVTSINGAWTALIPDALHIWTNSSGSGVGVNTFEKTFEWNGPIASAILDISADNSYKVWINGVQVPQSYTFAHGPSTTYCATAGDPVGEQCEEFNYRAFLYPHGQDQFDVASYIDEGENTLTVEVYNWHGPAFALYKLAILGDGEGCGEPEEETDVTICKIDEEQNPLPDWTVMLLGDHIDDVTVPSDGTEVISDALENGEPYAFMGSGAYIYRPGAEGDTSDAAFTERSYSGDPINPTGHPFEPWVDVNDLPAPYEWAQGYLGITVDDEPAPGTDWGTIFNSLHMYALGYIGNGSGAEFKILDDNYGDNDGSLYVDIYGGYVGVTGENGCVTFEDVPNGAYFLDEILQDGWTNIDGKGEEVEVNEESDTFYLVNSEEDAPICDPEVNLIENGGFEDPLVTLAQDWEIFPGGGSLIWLVDWMTGGAGNIELQAGVNGWLPYEGEQYAELDTHGNAPGSNVKIYQNLATEDGEDYTLSFAFSPRPGTNTADNEFEVWWNGNLLDTISADGSANGNTDWDVYTYNGLDGDESSTLEFRAIGTQNTLGTFLDDVALYCIPETNCLVEGYKYNEQEYPLSGWTIGIGEYNEETEEFYIFDTDVTNENGYYCLDEASDGDNVIFEELSDHEGWEPLEIVVNDSEVEFNENDERAETWLEDFPGEETFQVDFYNEYNDDSCLVEGYKYNDLNGDGNWDEGEPGLEGWTIGLNGNYYTFDLFAVYDDNLIGSDITDENGYYCIEGEVEGPGSNYEVYEVLQPGWDNTGVEVNETSVDPWTEDDKVLASIGYLGDGITVDFFNTDDAGSITINKEVVGEGANQSLLFNFNLDWIDQDIGASLTADDVPETFPGLVQGEYTITELMSAEDDWYLTGISCDGEVEHITNLENGSVVIGLAEDQDVTCTFTNTYRPESGSDDDDDDDDGTVSGYKWNDLNNDGEWDEGEPGLAGWDMQLFGEGSPLASDVTDGDGFYSITLSDGPYTLCEVSQSGWTQTYPNDTDDCHDVTIVADQNTGDWNFGNHQNPSDDGDSDDGGGSSSRHRSSSGGDGGEVLGEQITLLPAGAPNTGRGGLSMCLD